jgi:hypothetical protein
LDFGRHGPDVHNGLWCKWELAQGNFKNAQALWNRLRDKSLPVSKALRMRILERELQSKGPATIESKKLQNELDRLRSDLERSPWAIDEL